MKIKNSITAIIVASVIILVAGLLISNVLAHDGGKGLQGSGRNSLKGNMNNQQGMVLQQNKSQNKLQSGCTGECEDCAESNNDKNAFAQQKNSNGQNQGKQNNTVCTGDCDSCTVGNQEEGKIQQQGQARNRDINQFQEELSNEPGNGNQPMADCEYSYEITGQALKSMTIEQIAEKWEISADTLLTGIMDAFGLKGNYNIGNLLDDLRQEYRFRPAEIKAIAENIKFTL